MTTASLDSIVSVLWDVERLPLLRLVAREGGVSVREVLRELPGVDAKAVYRQLERLVVARWVGRVRSSAPMRWGLRSDALLRFSIELDRLRPGAGPAEVFDESTLRWEIEGLMHTGAYAPGGTSQLRLLLEELRGGAGA